MEKLWGLNFLKFYDKPWSIIATLSCAIFFIPGAAKKIADSLNEFGRSLAGDKKKRLLAFAAIGAFFIAVFTVFSSSQTLLGDGSLRVNQIEGTGWWLATEPLDFFLHAVIYRFAFKPLQLDAQSCYRWVSAFSGILFLFGAYRLAVCLNPKKCALNFLFICSSGVTVLFFGYIESYSLAAALMPWVFLAGLKAIENTASRITFFMFFLMAGLLHLVVAWIFSTAVLFMILQTYFQRNSRVTKISHVVGAIFGVFLLAMYTARYAGFDNFSRDLLGFFPQTANAQGILTLNHWINILNWLLLAALPALVLAPALIKTDGQVEPSRLKLKFIFWCMVPSFAFLFLFTPRLGGPRDWDLFSLPTFAILLAVLAAYNIRKPGGVPVQILPAIMVSVWMVFGFAGVNSSVVKSAQRQEEILEVYRFKNLYKDYANLSVHADRDYRLQNQKFYYALKAWQEPPLSRSDSVYILNRLSELALQRNDQTKARDFVNLAVSTDSTNIYGHLLLLSYYNQFESREKVLEGARLIAHRFSNNVMALSALGVIYSQIDSSQQALFYYGKAFQIDSLRFDVILNYGILLYQNNRLDRGLQLLGRAYQFGADSVLVNYHLSVAHFRAGHLDSARYYFEKVNSIARRFDELQLLNELRQILSTPEVGNDSLGNTIR